MTTGASPDRLARRLRRRAAIHVWARTTAAVVVITGLYFLVPLRQADFAGTQLLARGAGFLLGLAALTWLVGHQVRRALASRRRLAERIGMLIVLVHLVVVFFAVSYVKLADQFAGLDTRLDALYFAVTTLATVGYGDVVATGQAARAVVTVQMLFDLIIITSATSIVISALRGPVSPPAG